MTRKEVHQELLMDPKITKSNIQSCCAFLNAQAKLDAERRMNEEMDPYRKALMEEVYSQGMYNFDAMFGEE